MRVKPVPVERKVIVLETEYIGNAWIQRHRRERIGFPRELLVGLFDMIRIEMRIAQRMDKFTGLKPRRLRHHQGKQRIGRNVERHA